MARVPDAAKLRRTVTMAQPPVSIHEVSKEYIRNQTRFLALDRMSLEVPGGQVVSILGPSGCGKSTLLLMIAGLLPLTSGLIKIAADTVRAPYHSVGVVFQDPSLFEWRSVLQNILLPTQIRRL